MTRGGRSRRLGASLIAGLAICTSVPAIACEVRQLGAGQSPPSASVDSLAWLAGSWEGEGLGGRSFETISTPVAGQMVGHFQQVTNGAVQFYEFYQFSAHEGSVLLRLKHFHANMAGWETQDETVDFRLVALADGAAYFDGVTFLRDGENGLRSCVRVTAGGQERQIEFSFRRVGG